MSQAVTYSTWVWQGREEGGRMGRRPFDDTWQLLKGWGVMGDGEGSHSTHPSPRPSTHHPSPSTRHPSLFTRHPDHHPVVTAVSCHRFWVWRVETDWCSLNLHSSDGLVLVRPISHLSWCSSRLNRTSSPVLNGKTGDWYECCLNHHLSHGLVLVKADQLLELVTQSSEHFYITNSECDAWRLTGCYLNHHSSDKLVLVKARSEWWRKRWLG